MSKRVIYNKNNVRHMTMETTSPSDSVDRSGYIPLDIQYQRMMTAGAKLNENNDYAFNVDLDRLKKAIDDKKLDLNDFINSTWNKNLSKTDLDALLKDKLQKLDKQKDWNKEYNRLKKEYEQIEKDKAIRQEAINIAKEELAKQNSSS